MNMKRTCLLRHGDVMPAVGPNARTYGETTVGAGNAAIDLELIRYEGFEPQPFDLARDPGERDDLAHAGRTGTSSSSGGASSGRSSTRPRSTVARSPTSRR